MKLVVISVVSLLAASQFAVGHAASVATPTNSHVPKIAAPAAVHAATNAAPAAKHPPVMLAPAPEHKPAAAPHAAAAVPLKETPPERETDAMVMPDWYEQWVSGRLEIGTRYTHFKLEETQRGTKFEGSFLGSITELEADQDNSPDKLFAQYKFCRYAGVGISQDHVRAVTIDLNEQPDGTITRGTDGTVDAEGPIYYVFVCFPNSTRFTPYAELGKIKYSVSFEVEPGWSEGGLRTIDVQDTSSGRVLAAGLDVRIWKGISAGVYYQQVDADEVATEAYTAYGAVRLSKPGDGFPIRTKAYGLTVKYTF